jgi:glycosyltransferase involved in cell wall biosynthesis
MKRNSEASPKVDDCPLVSICLPVFNCEKTLATAIRSILNQSYGNWELLLMEDGSSDRSLEVARSIADPRISVFTDHSHNGLVPRLNRAIEMSRGKYFARIDGDDVAYPERLERQAKYLEEHPEVDLLGCSMLVFKGDGVAMGCRLAPETHEEICKRPTAGFHIWHPTWIGRTSWFRAHPYDAKAIRVEDQVLLLRSYSTSRFACLPDILVGYREESVSLSKSFVSRHSFCKSLLREAFDHGSYFLAARGLLGQVLKGLVDLIAVCTGLNYRLLPHRARPAEESVRKRWTQVWSGVQPTI